MDIGLAIVISSAIVSVFAMVTILGAVAIVFGLKYGDKYQKGSKKPCPCKCEECTCNKK